jgi:hypothetical protein
MKRRTGVRIAVNIWRTRHPAQLTQRDPVQEIRGGVVFLGTGRSEDCAAFRFAVPEAWGGGTASRPSTYS